MKLLRTENRIVVYEYESEITPEFIRGVEDTFNSLYKTDSIDEIKLTEQDIRYVCCEDLCIAVDYIEEEVQMDLMNAPVKFVDHRDYILGNAVVDILGTIINDFLWDVEPKETDSWQDNCYTVTIEN